ncbi:MAG: hypothetical protein EHM14_15340 [Methanothrix sp.]|nr:MAG: hypothetical protein EHM14_15340 [Methanothrix sp.]
MFFHYFYSHARLSSDQQEIGANLIEEILREAAYLVMNVISRAIILSRRLRNSGALLPTALLCTLSFLSPPGRPTHAGTRAPCPSARTRARVAALPGMRADGQKGDGNPPP